MGKYDWKPGGLPEPPRPVASLTEELVEETPEGFPLGWRYYRIEYGFESSLPEGCIWLPPEADPREVEDVINNGPHVMIRTRRRRL